MVVLSILLSVYVIVWVCDIVVQCLNYNDFLKGVGGEGSGEELAVSVMNSLFPGPVRFLPFFIETIRDANQGLKADCETRAMAYDLEDEDEDEEDGDEDEGEGQDYRSA